MEAWKKKQRREDLRVGRLAASIINFVGGLLCSNKYEGITALDVFPEHRELKVDRETMSEGTTTLFAHFKMIEEQDRLKKLEAARAKLKQNGKCT